MTKPAKAYDFYNFQYCIYLYYNLQFYTYVSENTSFSSILYSVQYSFNKTVYYRIYSVLIQYTGTLDMYIRTGILI